MNGIWMEDGRTGAQNGLLTTQKKWENHRTQRGWTSLFRRPHCCHVNLMWLGGQGFGWGWGTNKVLWPSFLGRCFSMLQYLTRSWCYWKSVNQKKSVKQKIRLLEVIKREVEKRQRMNVFGAQVFENQCSPKSAFGYNEKNTNFILRRTSSVFEVV